MVRRIAEAHHMAQLTLSKVNINRLRKKIHDPGWKFTPRVHMSWTSCSFFPGQRHPLFGFAVLDGLDRHVHRCCLIGPLRDRFRVAPCIKIGSVDRREKRPRIQVPKMAPKTGQKRGHPLWVPTLFVKNRVRFLAPIFGTPNKATVRDIFRPGMVSEAVIKSPFCQGPPVPC